MKALLRKVHAGLIDFCDRLHCYRLKMNLVHLRYLSPRGLLNFLRAVATELAYAPLDLIITRRNCPVCGWKGFEFSPVFLNDNFRARTRCPSCLTFERHRLLYHRLSQIKKENSTPRVLFVGPNTRFTASIFPDTSFTLDIFPFNYPDVVGDLAFLPFADAAFDLAVCFRVLEHVPADRQALEHLCRVLKRRGNLFLSVPLYKGLQNTHEYLGDRMTCPRGPTWSYPDHRRDYTIDDIIERIRQAGLDVKPLELDPNDPQYGALKTIPENDSVGKRMGLDYTDIVFECTPAQNR